MKTWFWGATHTLIAIGLVNIANAATAEDLCIQQSSTIEDKLSCLKGVTFKDITSPDTPTGAKTFDIQFEQWIDHSQHQLGRFSQRLVLIHRAEEKPTVLYTSGYMIHQILDSNVSAMFQINQLQIEHRFFGKSVPQPLDWSKLTSKQAADDFHRVVGKFKKIYPSRWVGTGSSKGGMTSMLHRRHYPNDVNGTIVNVTPLSFDTDDKRYAPFVLNIGGEAYKQCRENLHKIQVRLLQHRQELVPAITGTYTQLGSADVAFEHAVDVLNFAFWQYGDADDPKLGCPAIPHNGTPAEMYEFMLNFKKPDFFSDEVLWKYIPYFYQAATEFGNFGSTSPHLDHLKLYGRSTDQYVPRDIRYTYSNSTSIDLDQWMRTSAKNIIMIYGEFDSWTAAMYPDGKPGNNTYKFFVPKGNHWSTYLRLSTQEQNLAIEKLSQWLNAKPVVFQLDPKKLTL